MSHAFDLLLSLNFMQVTNDEQWNNQTWEIQKSEFRNCSIWNHWNSMKIKRFQVNWYHKLITCWDCQYLIVGWRPWNNSYAVEGNPTNRVKSIKPFMKIKSIIKDNKHFFLVY